MTSEASVMPLLKLSIFTSCYHLSVPARTRTESHRDLTPKTLSIARQRCRIDDRNLNWSCPVTLKHLPINLDPQPRPERDIDRTVALDDSRRNQIAAERV